MQEVKRPSDENKGAQVGHRYGGARDAARCQVATECTNVWGLGHSWSSQWMSVAACGNTTIGRIAAEATVGLGASGGWRGPYGEKDRALGLHGSDSMGHSGHMRGRTAQAGAGQAAYPAHAHARCRGGRERHSSQQTQAESDGEQR